MATEPSSATQGQPPKRRWRLQYSLRTLLVFVMLTGAVMGWWLTRYQRVAAQLADPETREQALYELLKAQRYRWWSNWGSEWDHNEEVTRHRINHVVICPQPSGGPIYAVFVGFPYPGPESGPGKAKGPLILVDSLGFLRQCYQNNDFVEGTFEDINGDGLVEFADAMWTGHCGRKVLHLAVVPITHAQRPILSVALAGPFGEGKPNQYWRLSGPDQDGICDIELDPAWRPGKQFCPGVVYKWSKEKAAYDGPVGGQGMSFMRLDPENESRDLEAFLGPDPHANERKLRQGHRPK